MNQPSIGVPTIGMPTLPNQWTEEELPHDLSCGVSMRVAFASMGSISKNAWVPEGWKEKVRDNWRRLRNVFMGIGEDWRKDYVFQGYMGSRSLSSDKRLKDDQDLDHWYLRDVMGEEGVSYVIDSHNGKVKRFVDDMSDRKNKKHPEKVTPGEYDELKACLETFHVSPDHWTPCTFEEKYRKMMAFLTTGESPNDETFVDERYLPNLSHHQAALVLWMMDGIFETDKRDIRFGPCPRCKDMVRWANESDAVVFHCEGCGVSVCDECRYEVSGDRRLDENDWWPEHLMPEQYCVKCCGLIEKHFTEAKQ